MDDLISRQAVIEALKALEEPAPTAQHLSAIFDCEDTIKTLPSAQPEWKKGRWIMLDKGLIVTAYKCSECGRTVRDVTGYDVSEDYPFCHCGADMMEEDA